MAAGVRSPTLDKFLAITLLLIAADLLQGAGACPFLGQPSQVKKQELGVINLDDPAARWEQAMADIEGAMPAAEVAGGRKLLRAPLSGDFRGQGAGMPDPGEDTTTAYFANDQKRRFFARFYPGINRTGLAGYYPPKRYTSQQRQCIINEAAYQVNIVFQKTLAIERGYHAANWLRLAFHDCAGASVYIHAKVNGEVKFVRARGGCQGSLLLAPEELRTTFNYNLQDFITVIYIKKRIDVACNLYLSVADSIQLLASLAIEFTGGPSFRKEMYLGRPDSNLPNDSNGIPHVTDNLVNILKKFRRMFGNDAYSPERVVALMGAHTYGEVRCFFLRDRVVLGDPQMTPGTLARIKEHCSLLFTKEGKPDSFLRFNDLLPEAPLDETRLDFDTNVFKFMQNQSSLIRTDNLLFKSDGSIDPRISRRLSGAVNRNAASLSTFTTNFKDAFLVMGMIGVKRI